MKRLLILFFVLAAANCFAQRQNVYYLKNDERLVNEPDSADFIRIVSEPDSGTQLYNVKEFYTNKLRRFVGKSSTIDPVTLQGLGISFDKHGRKKVIHTYVDGRLMGDEYFYFPNGKMYLQRNYSAVESKQAAMSLTGNFQIIACYDSLGNA